MSELNGITIRPAVKSECRTIAELYRISSDGVAEYIWTKIAKTGEDVLDVGPHRLIHFDGHAVLMVKELADA